MALLACSAPALAQTYQYPARYAAARPVQWFIDGGASITQGPTGNDFDNGWTFGTGVILRPDAPGPFALRFDLTYSRSDATSQFLALNEAATGTPIDYGTMQTVSGFVDGVLEAPFNSWVLLHTRLRCQHAGGEHRLHALRLARRGRSELLAPPRPVVVRGGALRAHRDAAAHRVHSDPLRVPVLGCRRRKRNARCEDARP
ncbi:MAG: hypothetical protein E6K48_11810 [Gammaproteobacteria bacterium]|nr:MAG: hypothetical protein E6K48_11810 [Gammaproteobacteria bacterium]